MPDDSPVRSRPLIDRLMLVAVVVCLGIALLRIALVMATFPYAAYVSWRADDRAQASGASQPTTGTLVRVRKSRTWRLWWQGRALPFRDRDGYLEVLSHRPAGRVVGSAVGEIAERSRVSGVRIDRVLMPKDLVALYGEDSGTLQTRADGTTFRTFWEPPWNDVRMLTGARVVPADYNPLITDAQAKKIASNTRLVKRTRSVLQGAPAPGGSGTWVLLAKAVDGERQFLFVPVEVSPVGGGL